MLELRKLINVTGSLSSAYLLNFLVETAPESNDQWVSSPKITRLLGIKKWDYTRDIAALEASDLISVLDASSRGTQIKIHYIELYNRLEATSLDEDIRQYRWEILRNKDLSNIQTSSSNSSIDSSNPSIDTNKCLSNIPIDLSNNSIDSSKDSIEQSPSLSRTLSLPLIREEREEKILREEATNVPEIPLCVTFSWESFRPSDYSLRLAEGTEVNVRLLASRFKDWHIKRNKTYCDMETAQQIFHEWLKGDIKRGSKYSGKGKLKLAL